MSSPTPTITTFYNDFSTTDEQANNLNTTTLLIQRRIQSLRKSIISSDDPIIKLDALADMISATAALASLPIAYDISSRDISDNARNLIQ